MALAGKRAHGQSPAGTGCTSRPHSPSMRAHCVQGEMWMEAPHVHTLHPPPSSAHGGQRGRGGKQGAEEPVVGTWGGVDAFSS